MKIGGCEEKLAVEYIVCFDKDDGLTNFSLGLGLIRMVGQAEVNMLLRREYQIIWDKIKSRLKTDTPETQFVVTGTAGIGKSAFRFFVLRDWLRGDDKLGFESIVFDEGGGGATVELTRTETQEHTRQMLILTQNPSSFQIPVR